MPMSEEMLRRSDLIRQRRAQPSKRRMFSKSHKRVVKSKITSPPPVMVRGGGFALHAEGGESRTIRRPRRRYDVALSTPGAEVRLPSLPRVRIGWRLFSSMLTVVLLTALYMVWNSPMYRVSLIEVKGLQRLSADEINAFLNLNNRSIFMVEPYEIKRNLLEAFPQLLEVEVQVAIPARVLVKVRERQPVLVWKQGEETLWVDAMGVAFPPHGEPAPSVVVESENAPFMSNQIEDALYSKESGSIKQASKIERFLPPQLVSAVLAISHRLPDNLTLKYSPTHGLGWRDPRGFDVYFGVDTSDTEMKLQVYQAIIDYFDREQIQPAMVSIEYLHAPYFRLEP
jgi:cell division protein FtsQ